MVETVIFDLGGTLIEYAGEYDAWPQLETPGFQAAYDYLAASHALPAFDRFRVAGFALLPVMWQQATRRVKNLRLVDLLAETLHACGVPDVSAAQLAAAGERYQTAVCHQAWLLPAARETVARVKAAGYKVGLVSNTMFTGAAHRADLARFGLLDYFDALLFSADVNKWKPNADPFRHVLDELEAKAETAVYIGDDPASDVVGGQAAGMVTIYVKSNQRFHKPNGVEPHAEVARLHEVVPLLAQWHDK